MRYLLLYFILTTLKTSAHYNCEIVQRIKDSTICKDCDYIPKLPNAGNLITESTNQYQIMHNGLKIIAGSYHTWMTEIIKNLNGHHEPQEEKAFFEVLKMIPNQAVMLELGSFWSYYSMWFFKVIPNAKNYLIEPVPHKLLLGKKHFEINQCQGTFIPGFIDQVSNYQATFIDWDQQTYHVPQLCIDDILEKYQIKFVNLLHCDIQGNEYKMLLGAQKAIDQHKLGYIFISTHATAENPHQLCLNFLHQNDFHIIVEHNLAESFSGDGLIVARPKWLVGLDYIEISRKKN